MSTTEAEYIAMSKACKEVIWLARLVRDLGITIEMPAYSLGELMGVG